jgi:hypothetical protein
MRDRISIMGVLLSAVFGIGAPMPPSAVATVSSPAWNIQALAGPTNFKPGEESGFDRYEVFVTNSGGKITDGSPITIADTLPVGLGVESVELTQERGVESTKKFCKTTIENTISTVTCTIVEDGLAESAKPATVYPAEQILLTVHVKVPPSAAGSLANRVDVEGGGAAKPASAESHNQINGNEEALAGLQDFQSALTDSSGELTTGADSRPFQYTTSFGANLEQAPPPTPNPFVPADGNLKQIEVALPPGLAGNPTSVPRCTAQQFNTTHGKSTVEGHNYALNECPDSSAIGIVNVEQLEGKGGHGSSTPLYNLVPPKGMPAQFGFQPVLSLPVYINTKLRSDGDYGVTSYLANTTEAQRVTAARVTIWGTPADPSHDYMRGDCAFRTIELEHAGCPANVPALKPFVRLPSSCASALTTTQRIDTWSHPGIFAEASVSEPAPLECDKPDFSPTLEAKATTNVADAPSGLRFDLRLPQKENEDPEGLGEADLRDARVTLPEGLLVNPSSADGLAACTESQIGYAGQLEGHPSFSAEPPNCPDAAKVGTVEVDAPAIDHPLPGAVYLATQGENPFDSLLAIYIAVDDPQSGVVAKLAGKVNLDPATGQLSTTVAGSPQVPFEDFKLDFFEGARAPLRTPAVCGTHTTTSSLTPWTAPASGPDATPSDSFETTTSPSGGACPTSAAALPNAPRFEAGSASPIAGAYSPFVVKLSRQDGSQELKGLNLTLPAGMAAKFAGVAECSDAAIASAETKTGKQEQASASCPASSHLGTVTVGAGAGPAPYYVKGNAYLAGPHLGAPLSMAIITPAVAGPFDLGTVVVRAPLFIDPETAQGTVKSTFPTILQGIPLDVRSIAVSIDRSDFTLNPTSCEAKAVTGEAISTQGQSVQLNNRFQVGGCQNLGFKPKLSLALKGGTRRGGHPSLKATLTYPKGGAYSNIAYAQVALPHSEFLDQGHIGTVCTRVQFAAKQCPAKSVYGHARAITPLFDQPLEGPVYLRSSNNQLPDLVADLNGQVQVVLDGKNDSIHGGIRNTFEAVPDAPVSKFTLTLSGAKKGLLENSTDICRGTHKANARFVAHNGKVVVLRPELVAGCGGKAKGKRKRR